MPSTLIRRPRYLAAIESALAANPICALMGPRQSGKTTLAQQVAKRHKPAHLFDLESASGRAPLADPELGLTPLTGLVVIDEIQRQPQLFEALRPLADRPSTRTRFLVLGSASPDLIRGVSESLAGRVGVVDLGGFDLTEVGARSWRRLWLRGGFPRSYLAASDGQSLAWRRDFIRTFLERDVPQLGIRIPGGALQRFWLMLAHYHGQIWNGAELARSLGVSDHTARGYLDVLSATYVLRQLPPWFANIGKRQYKAPKVYIRDSGLLHALLSVADFSQLGGHPKLGASWEGFALEQVLSVAGRGEAFYWGTHAGAELDLLLFRRGRRYGIEFKYSAAPAMTKSLHVALTDLELDRAWIVCPGQQGYPVHERVEVLPLADVPSRLAMFGPTRPSRIARRQ